MCIRARDQEVGGRVVSVVKGTDTSSFEVTYLKLWSPPCVSKVGPSTHWSGSDHSTLHWLSFKPL